MEQVLEELQQQRAERLARSVAGASEISTADLPSVAGSVTDGGDEKSLASESFVHTSQIADSVGEESSTLKPPTTARSKRSKAQLWNQVKIDCEFVFQLCD